MTLVVDHSGKVFGKKKPTLKDLQINNEDWEYKKWFPKIECFELHS